MYNILWHCFLCVLRVKNTFEGWTEKLNDLNLRNLREIKTAVHDSESMNKRLNYLSVQSLFNNSVLFYIFKSSDAVDIVTAPGKKIKSFVPCNKYLGVWLDQASCSNLCLEIDAVSVCWTVVYHSALRLLTNQKPPTHPFLFHSLLYVVLSHYYIFMYKVTLDKLL